VDGIVALTGGGLRLDVAVALLERGYGKRLLISGVNARISKADLKKRLHGRARYDCCADLGYDAADTIGNARETAVWVRAHHYRSILLVTSRYHMPRSIAEFHATMPGVRVTPYPVEADASPNLSGLVRSVRLLHGEYLKYLAVTLFTAVEPDPGLDRKAPAADSRGDL
jgi:uncharacterized SAM-binding protein YcdF (DUF218 family)